MTNDEILEFFTKRYEAWQRHDSDALAANHAENGELESPLRGKVKGHDAIHYTYSDFFVSFPDAKYVTQDLLINGNKVAQFMTMTGTQKGSFCGLPPSGKCFQMNNASLFTFEGNKIAHEFRIYDFTGMLVQLGVLKAKVGV